MTPGGNAFHTGIGSYIKDIDLHIEAGFFNSDDVVANGNEYSTTMQGSVLPKYLIRIREY